jgi:hypothetical protein
MKREAQRIKAAISNYFVLFRKNPTKLLMVRRNRKSDSTYHPFEKFV